MSDEAVVIGSAAFARKLAQAGKPEPTPEEAAAERAEEQKDIEQLAVSIDAHGNVIGDTSHLPEHILAQLSTPEAAKMMREQYRASRYGTPEPPREVRYVNERQDRRIFADSKPPGMTTKEWRTQSRARMRKWRKAALKTKRSIDHGRKPDQSDAGSSHASSGQ